MSVKFEFEITGGRWSHQVAILLGLSLADLREREKKNKPCPVEGRTYDEVCGAMAGVLQRGLLRRGKTPTLTAATSFIRLHREVVKEFPVTIEYEWGTRDRYDGSGWHPPRISVVVGTPKSVSEDVREFLYQSEKQAVKKRKLAAIELWQELGCCFRYDSAALRFYEEGPVLFVENMLSSEEFGTFLKAFAEKMQAWVK